MEAHSELRPPFIGDSYILAAVIALVLLSLVMIYSTTGISSGERLGDSLYYVKRQSFAALLGFFALIILSKVNTSFLFKIAPFAFIVSFVLITLTLVPGIGIRAGGATRWVSLGPLRFEPVELMKLATILFMARYFAKNERRLSSFLYGIVVPFSIVALLGVVLLSQPDFGSTAVIMLVTLGMMLGCGVRLKFFIIAGVLAATAAIILIAISPYRMLRILSFLDPTGDPAGKGYQLVQSLIAVGSGQLAGVGLGASQQKLYYLPAAHTDFIFSVIAEELGFLGCLMVIALFCVLLWRGLKLTQRLHSDTFSFALALGLTLLLIFPAFLNIGVVLGLLPTKGLVLPMVGFGGSSLIGSLMAVGLLLSLSKRSSA